MRKRITRSLRAEFGLKAIRKKLRRRTADSPYIPGYKKRGLKRLGRRLITTAGTGLVVGGIASALIRKKPPKNTAQLNEEWIQRQLKK